MKKIIIAVLILFCCNHSDSVSSDSLATSPIDDNPPPADVESYVRACVGCYTYENTWGDVSYTKNPNYPTSIGVRIESDTVDKYLQSTTIGIESELCDDYIEIDSGDYQYTISSNSSSYSQYPYTTITITAGKYYSFHIHYVYEIWEDYVWCGDQNCIGKDYKVFCDFSEDE